MTYFNYDPYMNYNKAEYRGFSIRGPLPDFNGKYISYIGAAQTFGRFCDHPFPDLISKHFNVGGLNLSFGGGGPEEKIFYKSIEDINKSKCCVFQVMSGRSCSNGLLTIKKGLNSRLSLNDEEIAAPDFWHMILQLEDIRLIEKILESSISTYLYNCQLLLSLIECPKILLFYSQEKPKDNIDTTIKPYNAFIGKFPHFITNNTLNKLKELCDCYAEVISVNGIPQKLKEPNYRGYDKVLKMNANVEVKEMHYNNYYPSPEIHVEIAEKLYPLIEKFI